MEGPLGLRKNRGLTSVWTGSTLVGSGGRVGEGGVGSGKTKRTVSPRTIYNSNDGNSNNNGTLRTEPDTRQQHSPFYLKGNFK